ncbi:MAG: GYD domain-containing protein, partial [Chloroflexota bacterium]|nr:GYD domain-containing protein [Chloroflexota bacterium]
MATYIVLGTFTDQGRTTIKDTPERRDRGRERAKELGVTFTAYVTMGAYDVIWVVEAPNDEAVAKFIVTLG